MILHPASFILFICFSTCDSVSPFYLFIYSYFVRNWEEIKKSPPGYCLTHRWRNMDSNLFFFSRFCFYSYLPGRIPTDDLAFPKLFFFFSSPHPAIYLYIFLIIILLWRCAHLSRIWLALVQIASILTQRIFRREQFARGTPVELSALEQRWTQMKLCQKGRVSSGELDKPDPVYAESKGNFC